VTFLSSDDPRVVSMWPHLVHGLSVHDEDGAHTHVLWAPRPRTEMIINIISAMYGVMKKNAFTSIGASNNRRGQIVWSVLVTVTVKVITTNVTIIISTIFSCRRTLPVHDQ
jgi:hypothetical protein